MLFVGVRNLIQSNFRYESNPSRHILTGAFLGPTETKTNVFVIHPSTGVSYRFLHNKYKIVTIVVTWRVEAMSG